MLLKLLLTLLILGLVQAIPPDIRPGPKQDIERRLKCLRNGEEEDDIMDRIRDSGDSKDPAPPEVPTDDKAREDLSIVYPPRPIPYPYPSCMNYPTCQGTTYDPQYAFCCNERLHWKGNIYYEMRQTPGVEPQIPQLSVAEIVSDAIWIPPYGNAHDSCCNGVTYASKFQMCCDGNLIDRKDENMGYRECCGKDAYNPNSQLCCGGKVYKGSEWGCSLGCCNGVVFKSTKDMCCDGVLYPIDKTAPRQCCGSNTYDVNTELCCYNCIRKKPDFFAGCCGNNAYTPYTQMCCGDKVYDKEKATDCCWYRKGSSFVELPYDRNKQVCCVDGLHDAEYGPNTRCCYAFNYFSCAYFWDFQSVSVYNSAHELCCNGIVSKIMGPSWEFSCCGVKPYNYYKEICCGNVIHPREDKQYCCGINVYNLDKQICCNNAIQDRYDEDGGEKRYCCGCAAYNPDTHVCCGDYYWSRYIVMEKEGTKSQCCGLTLYDQEDGVCCEGIYYEGHNRCCGRTPFTYNYAAPLYAYCCGDQPIQYDEGCCWPSNTVFNLRTEVCCSGRVISLPESKDVVDIKSSYSCCGDQPINYRTHVCCCNCIYAREDGYNGCCRDKPYNWETEICCYTTGEILNKDEYEGCCSGVVPYTSKNTCCWYGRLVPAGEQCYPDDEKPPRPPQPPQPPPPPPPPPPEKAPTPEGPTTPPDIPIPIPDDTKVDFDP